MKTSRFSSIGVRMFRTVMTVYMVVAVSMTLLLIYEEYKSSRESVLRELKMCEDIFDSLLAPNFWAHDIEQLKADADGMLSFPIISGLILFDHKDRPLLSRFNDGKNLLSDQSQKNDNDALESLKSLKHHFPVYLSDTEFADNKTQDEIIGSVTIFAAKGVEFKRIRSRVFFIILTAIVKFTVLWIIFLWVSRRMLTNPLVRLNTSLNNLDIDNPATIKINLQIAGNNELTLLEETFNQVGKRLYETYREKERAMALEKEAEEAKAANKAKSMFLANMSHELRTPMNAILGFARLTAQNRQLPPDLHKNLRIINRSGEHLLNLINDVLDMSKIEAGRTVLNDNDFDLHGMLDDLENMMGIRANEKNLDLTFMRDPDVIRYVRTDEVKLRQTLINLISNAVKFTEQGEVRLLIRSEPEPESELATDPTESETRLYFEVRDTGPGIAPEDLDRLFEAFVQTETGRRSQEGTGLGLPISRKFVQLMGGDITVESKEGTGTVFRFDIRVHPADAPDVPQGHTSQRVAALEPGQPAYRILVVDDKADNRHLLVKLLQPLGFEIREAENGQEAVEIWRQWKPHLIWMDMRMPVMNGYDAAAKIKESAEGRAVAVIALTASVYEEERSAVLSAGCDGFVRKPYHEHEIFEEMAKYLGVRYIYESSPDADGSFSDDVRDLTPDDLLIMPEAWRTKFREVVMAGYYDECLELIEQIPAEHAALISGLKNLVDNFAFDILVQLNGKTE